MPTRRKHRRDGGLQPKPRDITPVMRPSDPTMVAARQAFGPGAEVDFEPLEWDGDVVAAMTPLSTCQQAFVLAYAFHGSATHGNATRSALVVGVSPNTGYRWVHTDGVAAAILAIKNQTFRRLGIDAEWHLRELLRLYQEANEIDHPAQRIGIQAGLLDRIGMHKDVASKASDKVTVDINVRTYEEVQQARSRMLTARRAEQGPEHLQ